MRSYKNGILIIVAITLLLLNACKKCGNTTPYAFTDDDKQWINWQNLNPTYASYDTTKAKVSGRDTIIVIHKGDVTIPVKAYIDRNPADCGPDIDNGSVIFNIQNVYKS